MLVKLNNKRIKVKTKNAKFLRLEVGYNVNSYTKYSVIVKSNSDDMGQTSGSGLYKTGTTVTISAIPLSGYKFVEWSDGNTEATRVLTVTEDIILTAYFEHNIPVYNIPLTFTAEEAGSTIKMSKNGSAPTVYLETSPTGEEGSWSDFIVCTNDENGNSNNDGTVITLANVGDKVYFRAKQDNERFGLAYSSYNYNSFVMTGKIAASGNINTLLKADGSVLDLTGRGGCYSYMFENCTSLTQAPELPATTLAETCYSRMFQNCSSLTQVPELPVTTLANSCYSYMFYNCSSLTQVPELPATTLANNCYYSMFEKCTYLTQVPELPATTLASACYYQMFRDCSSITQAPKLPATTLADSCYYDMFNGCISLTQAPALLATTLANNCCANMFYGCTSLTQAPELPATTLADSCYSYMFYNCSKLNNINVNFSAWNSINAITNWVSNVSSSGTFTCPKALPQEFGNDRIPRGWTVITK